MQREAQRHPVRGGGDAHGDGVGEILAREPLGTGRGPGAADGLAEGGALLQALELELGGAVAGRGQRADLLEPRAVVGAGGLPGGGQEQRVVPGAAGPQQAGNPSLEVGAVHDEAVLDRGLEAVAVGVGTDREARREPGHQPVEGALSEGHGRALRRGHGQRRRRPRDRTGPRRGGPRRPDPRASPR